jgi:hypothetical protein
MRKTGWISRAGILAMAMGLWGCESLLGPDRTGEITLSSQSFGTESYYIFGYSFEDGEMYRYPYPGEPVPDIINEGYLVIEGSGLRSLPGFHSPENTYGFALVGEFASLAEARSFYENYAEVEEGLQFEVVSDTVELYQVWVQQTTAGNYAKLLVKDVNDFQVESGKPYSEVRLEFTYQPDGSASFGE